MQKHKSTGAKDSRLILAIIRSITAAATILISCWFGSATPTSAQSTTDESIAIIAPRASSQEKIVYDAIIDGARKKTSNTQIIEIAIDDATPPATLSATLERANAVITIGRIADEAYKASGVQAPQIVGGLELQPARTATNYGVALTPDPQFLFARLKTLKPETTRIIVVFDKERDSWLIERANDIASAFDIEIVAYEASSLTEASTEYWNILKYANPHTDTLWFLSNPNHINDSNLRSLIEQSWRRRFTIISNDIDHVRRGALLATYPDLEAMGAQLVRLAASSTNLVSSEPHIEPLGAVKFAVNKRIANRLGVTFIEEDERSYGLVFGER